MRRVLLLAAAITVVCVPSAFAAGKATTRVTFDHIQVIPAAGGTAIYTGDIFSSEKACKNKRRVYVYRVLDGPDEAHGSTLSYKGSAQPGYYWGHEEVGNPPPGDYYAKVRSTDDCKADRSPLYDWEGF